MTLGTYLRESREACGYTRAGLARRCGITKGTLIAIEDDATSSPGLFTVLALCELLALDPRHLCGLERPGPRKQYARAGTTKGGAVR